MKGPRLTKNSPKVEPGVIHDGWHLTYTLFLVYTNQVRVVSREGGQQAAGVWSESSIRILDSIKLLDTKGLLDSLLGTGGREWADNS